MPNRRRLYFARNIRLGILLENFLVSSIASLLVIRFYLVLTGFPQIGGNGLHIAHLLWGGLFMLITIVLLLAFLGRRIQNAAAILGGIGFGTFIDELGKFITSDDNYFFQPTIAIIYIIFILLFLGFRAIERAGFSEQELLANALDAVKEVVLGQSRAESNQQTLRTLHALDSTEPLVKAITAALEAGQGIPASPRRRDQLVAGIRQRYQRLVQSRQYIFIFIAGVLGYIAVSVGLLWVGFHATERQFSDTRADFVQICLIGSAGLTGVLLIIGLINLTRSRLNAYVWCKRGILVSILVTQVFLFYIQQLDAIVGLAFNLLILAALNYTIRIEYQDAPHHSLPITPTQAAAEHA